MIRRWRTNAVRRSYRWPGPQRPGARDGDRPSASSVAADGGRPAAVHDTRAVGLATRPGANGERDGLYGGMRRLASVVASGTGTAPQTLDRLLCCAVEASEAVAGALYALEADDSLRLAASQGLDDRCVSDHGGGPEAARAAIAAKSPILRRGALLGGDITLVGVPLMSPTAAAVGALCCYCRRGSRPRRLTLAYLSLVAAQASSALQTAHTLAVARDQGALDERHRLARELHDSASQALYSIGLGARTARELLDRDPGLAAEPIDYVLQLAEIGLVEMREIIFELRPEGLAEEGLVAALDKQIAALVRRHGVTTHAELGSEPAAATDVKWALYRVAREALQNVARHARAAHVTVRLDDTPADLVLEISDDGVGFDHSASFPGHLGLASMRERITDVGGDLDIGSAPGEGTRIRARVPTGH